MQIDTHFPLAIYQTQLDEGAIHKSALVERIWQLHRLSGSKRTGDDSSWTGDVHNIDMLHADPSFDWLTQQVGYHAFRYLDALGHDLTLYDLYFQRSWPIMGGQGQAVAPHTHPTAHLSAVYYVSIPSGSNSGKICFFNDAKPNDLFEGLNSHMTQGYKAHNPLNTATTAYAPVEGRLLLFPSSCNHAVEANETGEPRISISYDLMLTYSQSQASGSTPEFLLPSPIKWRRADANGHPIGQQSAYIQPFYLTDPSQLPAAVSSLSAQRSPQSGQGMESIPMMKDLPLPTQGSRAK